jgi:hypothetical protein
MTLSDVMLADIDTTLTLHPVYAWPHATLTGGFPVELLEHFFVFCFKFWGSVMVYLPLVYEKFPATEAVLIEAPVLVSGVRSW